MSSPGSAGAVGKEHFCSSTELLTGRSACPGDVTGAVRGVLRQEKLLVNKSLYIGWALKQ